jgi:ParB family chromosome partitioning protein
LADSIGRNGILHPITVRICERGFEIVAGNRRYYACKSLGWRKIPCNVTDLDDKEAFEISIIENVQRKTLDPVEEAKAFKKYVIDYGWGGVSDLAEKLSKSPSYISKRIKLNELPVEVLELISESSLSVTAAEELLYMKNTSERSNLAAVVSRRKISTRTVRKVVGEMDLGRLESDFYDNIKGDNGFDRDYRIISVMDKSIVVLKTAMNKMADLIESLEDNWLFYDILMQHKNMINSQIDLLIRQKRKSKRLMSRRFLV